MQSNDARRGIGLMIATTAVFAAQDGISRYLAAEYNVVLIVMIRYWFFALFVLAISARRPGGIRGVARTRQPVLQIFRGVLLVAEIGVTVLAFTLLGLIGTHTIFAVYPLMIAALSGPVLGEAVGWRRWAAIGVGFLGVLVILRPGFGVFAPEALIAVLAAFMFAAYGLATRFVARDDDAATSFFWTGIAGAAAVTLALPFVWEPLAPRDWGWMAVLCVTGALGHWLLIKAYEAAEASTVQPFAYFQLVFVSVIGLTIFGETLDGWTAAGAAIVVGAGLYTLWRERRRAAR
ncbi:MAG: DMT family transporter [Pseudomonadota bacterium]